MHFTTASKILVQMSLIDNIVGHWSTCDNTLNHLWEDHLKFSHGSQISYLEKHWKMGKARVHKPIRCYCMVPSFFVFIQGDSSNTPVEIEATVEKGALHLFGLRIPLPIKGSGKVNLVYIDNKSKIMRIFNSQGSISVQVREDWLQNQLQWWWEGETFWQSDQLYFD